ncbi:MULTISPECIES: acyltransferase [Clostridium]|uniref:acyltransferase family protein n=1 Tax=Clostridium TaxID=1485 RepID=UPI0018996960|nr:MULTISPECIES: acyltransferase [Clostridium]MDI9215790.1 acyltransferase [Clostridium tertium]
MQKENTIKEIEYIKGIAIILVFIGHAATPSFLKRPYTYEFLVQLIYSMHMPLFFLVSGFLSLKILDMDLKKDYFSFIKNKFYRLGIPFLTLSIATNLMIIVFKIILNQPNSSKDLINMIKTIFLYPENGIMGALWFLYTLFIISIISPIIVKLPMRFILTLGVLINIFFPKEIYFLSLNRVTFFLVYFLIGLYFRKYCFANKDIFHNKISNYKKIFLFMISIACVFFYSYLITNQIFITKYLLNTLNFLCGLSGMILVLIVIEGLKNSSMCNILSFLGRYSIDIYIFSWFFQIASMILITYILKISNYSIFLISNLFIGSFCLPFALYIIRKFKILKFLFLGEFSK